MPEDVRGDFERRFGTGLDGVRIHDDAGAADLARAAGAEAFTAGRSIVFAEGRYDGHSTDGRQLLAHELGHVVQQRDAGRPAINRKIDRLNTVGCSVEIELDIGLYGSRATSELAARWQSWINTRWAGTAACTGNSAGSCTARVHARVAAHPSINWWWLVPESNSVYVREPGYRSQVNIAVDSGDWAENEDELSVAHETGHFMGLGDKYWDLPWIGSWSESGFVNDIMANYYKDPGPTIFGPALTRVLDAQATTCPCCVRYPPCDVGNCALSPGLPCHLVGERRHCEWIWAHNGPEALARYGVDCRTLPH